MVHTHTTGRERRGTWCTPTQQAERGGGHGAHPHNRQREEGDMVHTHTTGRERRGTWCTPTQQLSLHTRGLQSHSANTCIIFLIFLLL